jgi:hypothetical protein
MIIDLQLRVGGIQGGMAARAVSVPLAGHGRDQDRAVASLVRAVLAWCHGLQADGALEQALRDRGIRWRSDGHDLTVQPNVLRD